MTVSGDHRKPGWKGKIPASVQQLWPLKVPKWAIWVVWLLGVAVFIFIVVWLIVSVLITTDKLTAADAEQERLERVVDRHEATILAQDAAIKAENRWRKRHGFEPIKVPGIRGLPGTPGQRGPKGDPGRDGRDGRDGVNGIDGTDGLPGRDGADGTDGRDGADGQDGQPGVVNAQDACEFAAGQFVQNVGITYADQVITLTCDTGEPPALVVTCSYVSFWAYPEDPSLPGTPVAAQEYTVATDCK